MNKWLILLLLTACNQEVASYCPQPVKACPDYKAWLKRHNQQEAIPMCGVIYLKQLGDQQEALATNCVP